MGEGCPPPVSVNLYPVAFGELADGLAAVGVGGYFDEVARRVVFRRVEGVRPRELVPSL